MPFKLRKVSTQKWHIGVWTCKSEPEKKSTRRINLRVSKKSLKIKHRGIFSEVTPQDIFMENIQRYFVFQKESNILILGVQEGEDKYIIILQLKNSVVIDRVCDAIDSSKGNTIRDISKEEDNNQWHVETQGQGSSSNVVNEETDKTEVVEEDFSEKESVKDEMDMKVYDTPEHHSPSPQTSPASSPAPSPAPSPEPSSEPSPAPSPVPSKHLDILPDEEIMYVQDHVQRSAKPPKAEKQSKPRPPVEIIYANKDTYVSCHPDCRQQTHDGYCDEWEINESHSQWDPDSGARIVENGPIYMYVAHQKHPHYSARFTCESDSDDTDSSFAGPSSSTSSSTSRSSREKSFNEENKKYAHEERRLSRQGGYYNAAFTGSDFNIKYEHEGQESSGYRGPAGFEVKVKTNINSGFGSNPGYMRDKEEDQISAKSINSNMTNEGPFRRDSGSIISGSIGLPSQNHNQNSSNKSGFIDQRKEDNVSFNGTGRSIHSSLADPFGDFSFNLTAGVDNDSKHSRGTTPSINSSKAGDRNTSPMATDFAFPGSQNQKTDASYTGTASSIHSGQSSRGYQTPLGSMGYNFNPTGDNVSLQSSTTGRSLRSNNTDTRRQLPSPGVGHYTNTNEDNTKMENFMDFSDRDSLNKTPTGDDRDSLTNGSMDLHVNAQLGFGTNNYLNSNTKQGEISAKF